LVGEYGPGGTKKYKYPIDNWEIWNEPNMPFPLKSGEAPTPELERKVNPKAFALFLKEMSEALRAGAGEEGPSLTILAPGLFGYKGTNCGPNCHDTPRLFLNEMNKRLKELEKPGQQSVYDAVSIHPYVFTVGLPGKKHAPTSHAEVLTVTRSIEQTIAGIHKAAKKPVWVTEIGFPVENKINTEKFPPVKENVQKMLVGASFAMMQNGRKRLGISHVFYYNIQDRNEDGWDWHCGLLDYGGTKREAFGEYKNFAK
jgi:hypothetical protein